MQFSACTSSLTKNGTDCLTIFVDQDANLASKFSPDLEAHLAPILSSEALGKVANSSLVVPIADYDIAKALLVYRLPNLPMNTDKLRELTGKLAAKIIGLNYSSVAVDVSGLNKDSLGADLATELTVSLSQADYRFEKFKSKKKPERKVTQITFADSGNEQLEALTKSASIVGEAVNVARDLGNMPGNACTPSYLANKAESMAEELGIKTSILDEQEMHKLGMGSLLSVSAGSEEPAKLIVMEYQGAEADEAPYALVGKGITFDTGGISLKPGAAMDEMKFDMCGAASVFGTVTAVAKLKLPINLVAVVAAAENMPSGCATKPGDIVTSMAGKTIEVLNTDAEGRLVLCDALSYVAKYNPKTIVDIATLTGACVIALGAHASGLYANDDELAEDLLDSANSTGDKAWRMPLWPEYDRQLESNFADIANIGGREAGSVTAACFLARFTEGQKWAHLDIAGTAWKSGKAKGATGRPVRLLVDYLRSRT